MVNLSISYPKFRELKEAIRAIVKGPYTTGFPKKAHQPFERFRGRPYFYEKDCIGCTACAQVCPPGAIEFVDEKKGSAAKRTLVIHWDVCIFCGQCQANCPTEKGIMLSREFDLATCEKREALRQSIEKDLALCECCGEPVAPCDQIVWVAKKLGALCFSNPSLTLFYLRTLNLALQAQIIVSGAQLQRDGRIKLLCPRCRRKAVLKS